MMSSSAEVDSFLFLLGGLGREEAGGLVRSSFSESEENRRTEPRTWLFLIPLDTRSRSRTDRDFRFFRIPLHRGPSISPDDTLTAEHFLPGGSQPSLVLAADLKAFQWKLTIPTIPQKTPVSKHSTIVLQGKRCNYPNPKLWWGYGALFECAHEISEK